MSFLSTIPPPHFGLPYFPILSIAVYVVRLYESIAYETNSKCSVVLFKGKIDVVIFLRGRVFSISCWVKEPQAIRSFRTGYISFVRYTSIPPHLKLASTCL